MRGAVNYRNGAAAEDIVVDDYARRGIPAARRRWRGPGGEIDLILEAGEGLIFVEVKRAETHELAAQRLSRRQLDRICSSASDFLSGMPKGQLTDCRVDLALVDAQGRVSIIENVSQL
ncbi:YraN family protein [Frigidibacter sp. SLM-1]|nr:YraN family protein [Frigidibacter sp. ROC022]